VLPGVYAPAPFRAELERSLAMIATLDPADTAKRRAQVRAYHAARATDTRAQWAQFSSRPYARQFAALMKNPPDPTAVALAQRLTVSKAYVEMPQLTVLGKEP